MIASMRLLDYLQSRGISQAAFSRRSRVQPMAVNRLCRGLLQPGADTLYRIIRATDGEVGLMDFVSPHVLDEETDDAAGPVPDMEGRGDASGRGPEMEDIDDAA